MTAATAGRSWHDARYFKRFRPEGVWAQLFRDRFRLAVKRSGIAQDYPRLDCSGFRPPAQGGQMDLFG